MKQLIKNKTNLLTFVMMPAIVGILVGVGLAILIFPESNIITGHHWVERNYIKLGTTLDYNQVKNLMGERIIGVAQDPNGQLAGLLLEK